MTRANFEQDEIEFRLWEEMKHFNTQQLHLELTSPDESRRFAAGRQLHLRGGVETFDYAVTLSTADNPALREVAAFILGQLGTPEFPFAESSRPVLLNLLSSDSDSNVRSAAAAALGHLKSGEDISWLERAAVDSNADVRANVAFALGEIGGERATRTLMSLTYDSDIDVVSWAVIGLRFLDDGDSVVRARFVELLKFPNLEVADEAIIGLSSWRDDRVFPSLMEALHRDDVNLDLLEAARLLGDQRLLPTLRELLDKWRDEPPRELVAAIDSLEGS